MTEIKKKGHDCGRGGNILYFLETTRFWRLRRPEMGTLTVRP